MQKKEFDYEEKIFCSDPITSDSVFRFFIREWIERRFYCIFSTKKGDCIKVCTHEYKGNKEGVCNTPLHEEEKVVLMTIVIKKIEC